MLTATVSRRSPGGAFNPVVVRRVSVRIVHPRSPPAVAIERGSCDRASAAVVVNAAIAPPAKVAVAKEAAAGEDVVAAEKPVTGEDAGEDAVLFIVGAAAVTDDAADCTRNRTRGERTGRR